MASSFTCFICGGKLVVRNRKVAACENCGMEYTLESLREEFDGGNVPAAQPQSERNTPNVDNILFMAKSAYDSNDYKNSITYADQVLLNDRTNADAWFCKVGSFAKNANAYTEEITRAARYFSEACNCIADASKKSEFVNKMIEIFEEQAYLRETTTLETAKALCQGDAEVAGKYISSAFTKTRGYLSDSKQRCLKNTREYSQKDHHQSGYYGLICQTWNQSLDHYEYEIKAAVDTWMKMHDKCSISSSATKLFKDVEDFIAAGKQYMNTSRADDMLFNVNRVAKTIHAEKQRKLADIAAKKIEEALEREEAYWAKQPAGERERLDKEIKETEENIRIVKSQRSETAFSSQINDLNNRIKEAGYEINRSGGIFKAKRRKELEEYRNGLQKELAVVKEKHNKERLRLQRILDDLNNKLNKLKKQRYIDL